MAKRKNSRSTPSKANGSKRIVEHLTPRPELPRQLEGRRMIVLWRDGAEPGQRRGLAITVDSCPETECTCRVTNLDGLLIRDDVAGLEYTGESLMVSSWPSDVLPEPKRKILVEVDIDTGDVTPLNAPADPDLLAWVTAEIDGELLDWLHERWRIGKGWSGRSPVRRTMDLSGWERGELLGFDEVFEAERVDWLAIGDETCWVDTYLCPVPGCDLCAEADVVFSTVDGEMAGDVGAVQLKLRGEVAQVVERRAEPGQEARLAELWSRFSRRYDVGRYLAGRRARMQMVWPAVERAWRAGASGTPASGRALGHG